MFRRLSLLVLLAASPVFADQPVPDDHASRMKAGTELFEKSIGPAMKSHCLDCHGGEKTRAGFNLATRELLLAGGDSGPAVNLAEASGSLMLTLMRHEEEPLMPAKKPRLPDPLLADFETWIGLGAPYSRPLIEDSGGGKKPLTVTENDREYWAFRRLAPVDPPRLSEDNTPTAEVDRFLAAVHAKTGLSRNPEADRRTLARRASLDLLGLPPDPEEMESFLSDKSDEAWPNYLDRLLSSPRYGERQARHWMDVARFGESEGFEHDYDRKTAYHYRDFLIEAFNRDLPWDVMTSWQIAGDELAPDEPLALMATGFLAAGAFPTQLTEAEFERARYDELDDMAGTTGAAFLGLSVGCARCHDHKYDPIPASDYYRFTATFATAIRSEMEVEFHPDKYATLLAPWEEKRSELEAELTRYERESLEPEFAAWLKKPSGLEQITTGAWRILEPESVVSREKIPFTRQSDGSWLAGGKAAASDEYTVEADLAAGAAALRIEALTHESMPQKGPGRAGNGNFALGDLVVELVGGDQPTPVKLVDARATHQQNTSGLSVKSSFDADKDKSGWAVDGGGIGKDQAAVFVFEKPLSANSRAAIRMRFHVNGQHSLGRFRLAVSPNADAPFETGKGGSQPLSDGVAVLKRGDTLTEAQRLALRKWHASRDTEWRKRNESLQSHLAAKPTRDLRPVMICSEGVPKRDHHANGRGYPHFYPEVHQLERGDPKQSRGVVEAGFLQVLMPAGADDSRWRKEPPAGWTRTSFRRASLAAWMTDPEEGAGHLLARVIVNRVWQHHFGRGLVATPNDFGFQGERPTHPELLDWLAADFIANGWSLKRLHKQLMMTAAYRQSTAHDPGDAARDPENRFLWRFEPRRLEGEAIRDSLLTVSGLLDPTPFGPGSLDEKMRRRSVYFTVKRSKPVTSMLVFDWPEHLVSIGARPVTTVAPQSLYLMNSPQVREYAAALAKRSGGDIGALYRHALSRPASEQERLAARSFLQSQSARYEGRADATQLALTDYCHALLGSNEFLYLP
ncbi:MAG: PSD1 domain-containing protein [Verrucomicrobiae bacterium]|nr:PSD1 domain-containing protein [Verrucomicrobiae bacterium]